MLRAKPVLIVISHFYYTKGVVYETYYSKFGYSRRQCSTL